MKKANKFLCTDCTNNFNPKERSRNVVSGEGLIVTKKAENFGCKGAGEALVELGGEYFAAICDEVLGNADPDRVTKRRSLGLKKILLPKERQDCPFKPHIINEILDY